jgi:hypothetical protein
LGERKARRTDRLTAAQTTSACHSALPELCTVLTDAQFAGTKLSASDLSKAPEQFGGVAQKAGAEMNCVFERQIGQALSRRS